MLSGLVTVKESKTMADSHCMNEATCIRRSVFSNALTRGKKYFILETDDLKRQIKIQGDNKRVRWFPIYCFDLTGEDIPTLRRIKITDTITDFPTSAVDVEVELSNEQRRWCFFVTPDTLARNGDLLDGTDVRFHYGAPHMIVVSEISETIIKKALLEIESQGELIECTRQISRS